MSLAETFVGELSPTDESLQKLQQCCERWLTRTDIEHREQLKRNLMLTIKDDIVFEMQNPARRKRDVGR